MAERFARLGCTLVLWDINAESAKQAASELRQLDVDVHTYTCDVAKSDSVYHAASKVICLFSGTVKILTVTQQ